MNWFLYFSVIVVFVLIKFSLSPFSYIKSNNVTDVYLSILYCLIIVSIFYSSSIQEDISVIIEFVIVKMESFTSDLKKIIPKESLTILGPIIGFSSISCVTGIPLWLLNKTYENYQSIRYTSFKISELSEVAKWLEKFITSQSNDLNYMTQFDINLFKNLDVQRRRRDKKIDLKENGNKVAFLFPDNSRFLELSITTSEGERYDFIVSKAIEKRKSVNPEFEEKKFYSVLIKNDCLNPLNWGNSKKARSIFEKIIKTCEQHYTNYKDGYLEIYSCSRDRGDNVWSMLCLKMERFFKDYIMDLQKKENLLRECRYFLDHEQDYKDLGVPYHRGYLFYGPPGCGKSSFIHALASELRIPICILDLTSYEMSDSSFYKILNEAPKPSILLVEEIDSMYTQTEDKNYKEDSDTESEDSGLEEPSPKKKVFRRRSNGCKCSFQALLQGLDGLTAQEGRIVIFTTNHIDRVDSALKRKGRMDVHLEFTKPVISDIKNQFIKFLTHNFEKIRSESHEDKIISFSKEDIQESATKIERLLTLIENELGESFVLPSLSDTQVFLLQQISSRTHPKDSLRNFYTEIILPSMPNVEKIISKTFPELLEHKE